MTRRKLTMDHRPVVRSRDPRQCLCN